MDSCVHFCVYLFMLSCWERGEGPLVREGQAEGRVPVPQWLGSETEPQPDGALSRPGHQTQQQVL